MTKESTLAVYGKIGWVGIALGAVVLAVSPLVRRWMHLETLTDDDIEDEAPTGALADALT